MTGNNNKLRFENVSCIYPDSESETLKNVCFDLKTGSINAVLGDGGSGKTTLCNLISGIIPKIQSANVNGNIYINNKNIENFTLPDLSVQVGKVAQDPESMFCNLYVKDEVGFGLENLCIQTEIIKKRVYDILGQLELSDLADKQITKLSGGQIQRLAIACILVMEPDIIILDEPTANIDPVGVNELFDLLDELRNEGKTIVITSKEWYEHISMCDQVFILENGSIKLKGSPIDILSSYNRQLLDLNIYIPEASELIIRLNSHDKKIGSTVESALSHIKEYNVSFNFMRKYKSENYIEQYNSLFQFEDVSFNYPDGTDALRNINLSIYPQKLTLLVGQNGAGKSTLAKLMVGLLKPSHGNILFKGKTIALKDIYSKVGFVFQNPDHQFVTDTVFDELAYSLKIRNIDHNTIDEKVEQALNTFKLKSDETKHPLLLNAGQKRRLAVASILISEPEVIIIDEPTYGQDKNMTITLMSIMSDLVKQGISIIMITHDMRIVHRYSDQVYVFSEGNLLFDGKPSELFSKKHILDSADLLPTQLYRIVELSNHDYGKPVNMPRSVEELFYLISQEKNNAI